MRKWAELRTPILHRNVDPPFLLLGFHLQNPLKWRKTRVSNETCVSLQIFDREMERQMSNRCTNLTQYEAYFHIHESYNCLAVGLNSSGLKWIITAIILCKLTVTGHWLFFLKQMWVQGNVCYKSQTTQTWTVTHDLWTESQKVQSEVIGRSHFTF